MAGRWYVIVGPDPAFPKLEPYVLSEVVDRDRADTARLFHRAIVLSGDEAARDPVYGPTVAAWKRGDDRAYAAECASIDAAVLLDDAFLELTGEPDEPAPLPPDPLMVLSERLRAAMFGAYREAEETCGPGAGERLVHVLALDAKDLAEALGRRVL